MHIPVLQKEILRYLDPKPNENFIDCTIGGAGHTIALLGKNGPGGRVLGIELDSELYRNLKHFGRRFKQRLILVNDSYSNLKEIIKRENFKKVSGILFDLGMSSWHLEESGRGFSFLRQEPLDMRYSLQNPLTAEKIINYWSCLELEKILDEYGQERFAKRIAKGILNYRKIKPIKTTFQLAKIIEKATPSWYCHRKIHFATRTFQALRIAVNDELNNLKKVLPQALEVLNQSGRLVIISFHSLEDRTVKNFFRDKVHPPKFYEAKLERVKGGLPKLEILTKKPVSPSLEEIKTNPRARSAKLRAARKL